MKMMMKKIAEKTGEKIWWEYLEGVSACHTQNILRFIIFNKGMLSVFDFFFNSSFLSCCDCLKRKRNRQILGFHFMQKRGASLCTSKNQRIMDYITSLK